MAVSGCASGGPNGSAFRTHERRRRLNHKAHKSRGLNHKAHEDHKGQSVLRGLCDLCGSNKRAYRTVVPQIWIPAPPFGWAMQYCATAARTSSFAAVSARARSAAETALIALPARYFPTRFSIRIVNSSPWLKAAYGWRSGLSTAG